MLDPWVITKLHNQKGTSKYHAEFDAPTKEGIYQFKIIYEKPGFNFIKETERVTLRPKRHDEFERFLLTATPYYASVFATIFGSVIFIIVFLYSNLDTKMKKE
jgi:oligosaccharyltransferase complex subunit beta